MNSDLNFQMRYIDGVPKYYSVFHADTNTHLGYIQKSDDEWVYSTENPVSLPAAVMQQVANKLHALAGQ